MSRIPPNCSNVSIIDGSKLTGSPIVQKIDGPLPPGTAVNISTISNSELNNSEKSQLYSGQQEDKSSDLLTFILSDANNEKIQIERAHLQANAPEMEAQFKDGNEFKLMQVGSQSFAVFANFCKDGAIRKNEDVYLALDFLKEFKRQYTVELLKLKRSIESILMRILEESNAWVIFQKTVDYELMETREKVLHFIGRKGLRKVDDYQKFMKIPCYAKYLKVKANVN